MQHQYQTNYYKCIKHARGLNPLGAGGIFLSKTMATETEKKGRQKGIVQKLQTENHMRWNYIKMLYEEIEST